jgi:hypothetical protein
VDQRRHLYHARINAHLTLEQLGVRTALSPPVLRNRDLGRFELLPSGLYARSYVRTFAAAVGLDPDATLAELEPLLPGAPDPLPALNARDRMPADWVREFFAQQRVSAAEVGLTCRTWIAGRIAAIDAYRGPAQERLAALVRVAPLAREAATGVAERVGQTVAGLRGSPGVTRCGAAAIDALLLLVVDSFLVMLISWSSGIPLDRLLHESAWAIGAFCAIPIALYFLLFGGIAGSTLGRYVCSLIAPFGGDPADDRPGHPLTLPDILRRTFGH